MHGGKSRRWFASPSYVHGLYARYGPEALLARATMQQLDAMERAERIVPEQRAQREAQEARRRPDSVWSPELIEAIAVLFGDNGA